MENNSLAFIEKAITKTKNKSLQWNSLYMNSHLLNVQSVLTPTASPFSDKYKLVLARIQKQLLNLILISR